MWSQTEKAQDNTDHDLDDIYIDENTLLQINNLLNSPAATPFEPVKPVPLRQSPFKLLNTLQTISTHEESPQERHHNILIRAIVYLKISQQYIELRQNLLKSYQSHVTSQCELIDLLTYSQDESRANTRNKCLSIAINNELIEIAQTYKASIRSGINNYYRDREEIETKRLRLINVHYKDTKKKMLNKSTDEIVQTLVEQLNKMEESTTSFQVDTIPIGIQSAYIENQKQIKEQALAIAQPCHEGSVFSTLVKTVNLKTSMALTYLDAVFEENAKMVCDFYNELKPLFDDQAEAIAGAQKRI